MIFLRFTKMRGLVIFLVLVAYVTATYAAIPRRSETETGGFGDMEVGDCVSDNTDLILLCYTVSMKEIYQCGYFVLHITSH